MKAQMKEAKMHYDALMECLDGMGMALDDFKAKMIGGEEAPEMEEEEESEAPEMGEQGDEYTDEQESGKKPVDKAKVALIVARMKGKLKE